VAQGGSPIGQGMDVVTARAVASLGKLVLEAHPALRPDGGTLVCWKGDDVTPAERAEGDRRARARGLVPLTDLPYVSFKPCRLVRYGRVTSHD